MDIPTLTSIQQNFANELTQANAGKKTSLPFIVHELSTNPLVRDNETFQVLVIGGTVCRRALIRKTNGTIEIIKKEKREQPVFTDRDVFLSFIEASLDPNVSVLALNLAYPLLPIFTEGKLDGKLVSGSKEHTFEGVTGHQIGKLIEQHIKKTKGKDIKVAVANDTICLLLSGLTEYPWNNLACGILGTGLNFAIFLDKKRVVNLEAANFDKFPPSPEGKAIDKQSAYQGKALLEKETSGAYLYRHFNMIVKKRGISHPPVESTYELKKIALQDGNSTASEIARELIGNSASLISAALAGIVTYQKRDLVFVMDGSFFWEGRIYKNLVQKTLKELIPDHTITFVPIKDSTILGAAKLVA